MASEQCRKPSDQIHSGHHQKSSTSNEHSLSEKVKEMANSARKMFNHNEQQGHTHKPTTYGAAHEKTKKKKTEGHEHHCMPKMLDNMKKKKKKKSGSSSDSD